MAAVHSSATGTMLHHTEWAALTDLPLVHTVVEAILGPGYRCYGADGDFNLPFSDYQPLHSDMGDARCQVTDVATGLVVGSARPGSPVAPGTAHSPGGGGFFDPSGRLTCRDLPPMDVCVNFPVEALHALNGPMRIIPGTHHSQTPIPALKEEPDWMRTSTLCPLPAGSALFRDPRTWHGATPNLSDRPRAVPCALFSASWFGAPRNRHVMPREIFETLSPQGQAACAELVLLPGEELAEGYRDGFGVTTEHGMDEAGVQQMRNGVDGAGGSATNFLPRGAPRL